MRTYKNHKTAPEVDPHDIRSAKIRPFWLDFSCEEHQHSRCCECGTNHSLRGNVASGQMVLSGNNWFDH